MAKAARARVKSQIEQSRVPPSPAATPAVVPPTIRRPDLSQVRTDLAPVDERESAAFSSSFSPSPSLLTLQLRQSASAQARAHARMEGVQIDTPLDRLRASATRTAKARAAGKEKEKLQQQEDWTDEYDRLDPQELPVPETPQAIFSRLNGSAVPAPALKPDPPTTPADAPLSSWAERMEALEYDESGIRLVSIAVEDVDRLWDWIRQEPDGATAFFGAIPASSVDLHRLMYSHVKSDAAKQSVARSIVINGQHQGFALLYPVNRQDRLAVAHLYVAPSARHQLDRLLPQLLGRAEHMLPPGMRIAVMGAPGWQSILEPYGFVPYTMLIREAKEPGTPLPQTLKLGR